MWRVDENITLTVLYFDDILSIIIIDVYTDKTKLAALCLEELEPNTLKCKI